MCKKTFWQTNQVTVVRFGLRNKGRALRKVGFDIFGRRHLGDSNPSLFAPHSVHLVWLLVSKKTSC